MKGSRLRYIVHKRTEQLAEAPFAGVFNGEVEDDCICLTHDCYKNNQDNNSSVCHLYKF